PFHGFSVEFAEHRLYNTGESTKHIDWKLYARSDKLFIKRYEEETNLRCQIIIDHSSSMYFPFEEGKKEKEQNNKINFSIYAAAALTELLKRQRDAIGLSTFSDKIEKHYPARSSVVHLKLLFNELESMMQIHKPEDKRSTNAIEALHQIAEMINKRSLVMIFSDMFDSGTDRESLFSALQHLKHKKHEVILFHVTDKLKELDFNFENRPYRFIDMETGEELKINPTDIKESYLTNISEYTAELKLKCGQFGIDFVEADINRGFFQVLYSYLVKRQRLV
ncbi:MAG: DUF58 domain-containing protein, partial [Bacteroidia bacterium]|nr:DUF58 domain-containing protein [Bacteroidia bacterium]